MESTFHSELMRYGGLLLLAGVIVFFRWEIRNIKESNAKIKKYEALAKKKARQDAQVKKDAEFKIRKDNIYMKLLDASHKTLQAYYKDSKETAWIFRCKIDPILDDLALKSQEEAIKQFELNGSIGSLGPFVLDNKQLAEWHSEYRQAEANKARKRLKYDMEQTRKRNEARKKVLEKEKEWEKYKNNFKKLNKAQQKNEIEWFKKKVVGRIAIDEEQKDEYIHELEMIALSD